MSIPAGGPQLAFAGLNIISELFSQKQEQQQIIDQRSFIQAQQQAALADLSAFDLQTQAEQTVIGQETSFQDFEREREGLRERGAIRAAIAETGVLGNTPIRQLNQAFFQEALDVGNIAATGSQRIAQSDAARAAEATRTSGRISVLSSQAASLRSPNPFLSGLKIAGAGARGFATGQAFSSARKRFR